MSKRIAALFVGVLALTFAPITSAETVAETDFTGRTVSGLTASNISWTTTALADPGDMIANNESPGALPGLFDTADAQGHFAPDKNTGNEGPWSTDIALAPTIPSMLINSVTLDWQHFDNSGNLQGAVRSVDWTASIIGSSSGTIASTQVTNVSGMSGIQPITFADPALINDNETWTLRILAEGSNATGNNTGLDAITIDGTQNILLSTDFDGRTRTTTTVANDTASNITWQTNGVADPGDVVAVDADASGSLGGLFETADTVNTFSPDLNIHNEGDWSADILLDPTDQPILLEAVRFDVFQLNNSGVLQTVDRDSDWTVSVIGSSSGLLDSQTILNIVDSQTLTFDFDLELDDDETYTIRILATGQGAGNNAGIDDFFAFGYSIPEPSSALLLLIGGAALLRRRAA